jgi:small GTP-binding protein
VYIYRNTELLYYRLFGEALTEESFEVIINELRDEILAEEDNIVRYFDYYRYKISYISVKDLQLMVFFVTGLMDDVEYIKNELVNCTNEFLNLFGDMLDLQFDATTFKLFDPTIDSIHRNLRPKISLVGYSGVGKTTISQLIKAEEIPMQHVPTISGDISTIKIGKLHFNLWDFAGQEQFSFLWNNFIKGSDAVLIVTNSEIENVEKSKFFLNLLQEDAPYANVAAIGNKQDLPGAMTSDQIKKIMGIEAYPMIAIDPENRSKMIQIIAGVLEMSADYSPLLEPLLKRDQLINEALLALENRDYNKSSVLFEKISELCLELGDDAYSKEFYEKAQEVKNLVQKQEVSEQPIIAETPPLPQPSQPLPTIQPFTEIHPPSTPHQLEINVPISDILDLRNRLINEALKALENRNFDKSCAIFEHLSELCSNLGDEANSKEFRERSQKVKEMAIKKEAPKPPIITPKPQVTPPSVSSIKKMPVMPTKLIKSRATPAPITVNKPTPPISQKPIKPTISTPTPAPGSTSAPSTIEDSLPKQLIDSQQKYNLEQTILDLELKKAGISKMFFELEMQEISGEINIIELNEKKKRLSQLENKLEKQIQDLKMYLKKIET